MEAYRITRNPAEIWDLVTTMDGDVDRAWLIQNPKGFGCTEPGECARQDGAYVELMRTGGDWPDDFPDHTIRDREAAVWITLVNDHDQGACIVHLEPDAARSLVNALSEAISILDRRPR